MILFIFAIHHNIRSLWETTTASAGFYASLLSWSNWNLKILVFVEGEKPENPDKNPVQNINHFSSWHFNSDLQDNWLTSLTHRATELLFSFNLPKKIFAYPPGNQTWNFYCLAPNKFFFKISFNFNHPWISLFSFPEFLSCIPDL